MSLKYEPSSEPLHISGGRHLAQLGADEVVLHDPVQRFRGGLAFKAHRLVYHSTLGSRVVKKKKEPCAAGCG